MWNGRVKAYLTVYLSLIIGILVTFLTTMLMAVRNETIRFETECVMDMGLDSIFAEYHRECLKQYDLLFIDSSYGEGVPDVNKTKNHLLSYMNKAFKGNNTLLSKDLTALKAANGTISDVSFASDNRGEVLRYQIGQYMKSKYGLNLVSKAVGSEDIAKRKDEFDSLNSQRKSADGSVDEILNEINSTLSEEEEPYSVSNPADAVEGYRDDSMLIYALGERRQSLAYGSTDVNSLISHRTVTNGVGLMGSKDTGLMSDLSMNNYIFEKCGYFDKEKADSRLKYQIEYILKGKGDDAANLSLVASDIFKIRYAINEAYLWNSAVRKMEAEEVAIAATSAVGVPALTEAVKASILFAWGYAESAQDLRILYDGHPLPNTKNDSNWNISIAELPVFAGCLDNYKISASGMEYKDYLYGFLVIKNIDEKTVRLMDVMEMDIRKTPGNEAFRMDGMIFSLSAEVNVYSSYGSSVSIKRNNMYR